MQSTTMIRFVFALFFALILSPISTQADVLVEGEVDIRVKVLNLADFPEFDFYIEYQDYYYEYGWKAGDISQVPIKDKEEFETGDRGGSSKLFAKDRQGTLYSTENGLGGDTQIDDFKASYIVQEIKLSSVKDGVINYQVVGQYKVYPDGATKKIRKGMVLTGIYLFGMDLGVLLLPIVCLGGLIFFFWIRRNPVRTVVS
jgi:hypothetical protein